MVNLKNLFNSDSPIGLRSMGLSSKPLTNKNTPVIKKQVKNSEQNMTLFTSKANTQINTMKINFTPRNVSGELNSLFGSNSGFSFDNKLLG